MNLDEDINRTVPLIKAGCDTSPSYHITTTLMGGTVEFSVDKKNLEKKKRQMDKWMDRVERVRDNCERSIVSRRFSNTSFVYPHPYESEGHCSTTIRIGLRGESFYRYSTTWRIHRILFFLVSIYYS